MKKVLALALVVAIAACEKKADETPAADSGAMMAPDTATMMAPDTGMMMQDTTMPRDTMHQM